jgi:hypothetical protein
LKADGNNSAKEDNFGRNRTTVTHYQNHGYDNAVVQVINQQTGEAFPLRLGSNEFYPKF